MKNYIRIFFLLGLSSLLLFSPSWADNSIEKGDSLFSYASDSTASKGVDSLTSFYFPSFELSMDDFWSAQEVLTHDCQATTWLGGTSKASCREDQTCTCSSNLFIARCRCNDP